MMLSDISVKRPVFASVLSLLLIAFGLVAFDRLPLREYPDIDPPIVSVEVLYPGAAANVVETRITEVIEERIAGVEGIKFIESVSQDGQSQITIEFHSDRDVDAAANDIRDRVSSILNELPEEAEPAEIQKVDSNDDVIMWLNLVSDNMSVPELTDYADRYLVDRFSVLDGVARVRIGGGQRYAMRIWLDRTALAARGLTANNIEDALQAENVELPAGSIESIDRQFTIRTERYFRTPESFAQLVIARGEDGYLIRLADVARVEKGTEEDRTFFRGNGVPMVGIGIIKQSTANTIDVTRAARELKDIINASLPEGMTIKQSYDTSVFVEGAINEVYKTLIISIILVIITIYVFLGNVRAMVVPAVTVPVSLIASCTILLMLGFSINLLTLLALVLAIGLVVDDAIVMLENIYRRMDEENETPLVAAFRGARQVGFAIIATSLVLVAVFVPIAFLQGDIGRLFSEFALTMAAAVAFSTLVALSLSPMLASQILSRNSIQKTNSLTATIDKRFRILQAWYLRKLDWLLRHPLYVISSFVILLFMSAGIYTQVPSEYAPKEDRGAFFIIVNGPEGASYDYIEGYMDEIERRLMPYVESDEITRLLVRAPRTFNNYENFNTGIVINVLNAWSMRRDAFEIMDEIRATLSDLPGVRAFPVMRQGFGGAINKPLQFVIGGGTYEKLAEARDILVEKINENNPGLVGLDWDYKETKPQLEVRIDYDRAAELGVTISNIGRTLQTMLGSRQVTTYIDDGEEYDVLLEGERAEQRSPTDIQNMYVRSERSNVLIPLSNLVTIREFADSNELNRYNRVRAITLEANLEEGYSLGEAIDYLNGLVDEHLADKNLIIDYKGQSQDYQFAGDSIMFVFILGIIIVFLVLAAQFESYVHPFIIMLTVPLAMSGGLAALWLSGSTLNLYSQIGLIMLVGLAAKNGILIVEFANQLRDEGVEFYAALKHASQVRLRPILMTGITTSAGSVPLILASGAGAETRMVIGIVVFVGVLTATFFTLVIVPVAYALMARNTGSPGDVARRLEVEEKQ